MDYELIWWITTAMIAVAAAVIVPNLNPAHFEKVEEVQW